MKNAVLMEYKLLNRYSKTRPYVLDFRQIDIGTQRIELCIALYIESLKAFFLFMFQSIDNVEIESLKGELCKVFTAETDSRQVLKFSLKMILE